MGGCLGAGLRGRWHHTGSTQPGHQRHPLPTWLLLVAVSPMVSFLPRPSQPWAPRPAALCPLDAPSAACSTGTPRPLCRPRTPNTGTSLRTPLQISHLARACMSAPNPPQSGCTWPLPIPSLLQVCPACSAPCVIPTVLRARARAEQRASVHVALPQDRQVRQASAGFPLPRTPSLSPPQLTRWHPGQLPVPS